jgi:hypothetical protein
VAKKLKQPDDLPKIFVDRNLGSRRVVDAIRSAGYTAIVHDEYFDQATPDIEWLSTVGKKGWVVLSHDVNITKNLPELEALIAANVHAFIFKIKHPNGNLLVNAVTSALPHIVQIVNRRPPPSVGIVNKDGKIDPLSGYDRLVEKLLARKKQLEES